MEATVESGSVAEGGGGGVFCDGGSVVQSDNGITGGGGAGGIFVLQWMGMCLYVIVGMLLYNSWYVTM